MPKERKGPIKGLRPTVATDNLGLHETIAKSANGSARLVDLASIGDLVERLILDGILPDHVDKEQLVIDVLEVLLSHLKGRPAEKPSEKPNVEMSGGVLGSL